MDAIARAPHQRQVSPRVIPRPRRTIPGQIASANAGGFSGNQTRAPAAAPPYTGFQGLLDDYTVVPPDTHGAVGPRDVVTMLNSQVLIQSRNGQIRTGYPITLNDFWSGLGNFQDTFDPRMLYDAAGGRWIASSGVGGASSSSAVLIGVSRTGDPGGVWDLFEIKVGLSGNWADYPILGFNGNWIAVSVNLYSLGGHGDYVRSDLYVFNRPEVYQNGKAAYATFSDPNGGLTPAMDFDKRPDTFYFVQAIPGTTAGHIRLSALTGPIGKESFSGGLNDIAIADPWADAGPNGDDFAPQAGMSFRIDTGDSRLQSCVLRAGAVWCAHTVFLPAGAPTRAAVQWFEIDPAAGQILQRGRIEDSGNNRFYAYPSIAVNANNDVLIGYTRFTPQDYPSAAFSFRAVSDPPNTLEGETVFKSGESSYYGLGADWGSNRWGDYSVTLVDPVDDLTFWTIQEYAAAPTGGFSGRWGTWWAQIAAPSAGLSCQYSISQTSQVFGSAGGTGNVSVTAPPGCPWMAASNAGWITVGSGNPGSGNGTVGFVVSPGLAAANGRIATLTIAGQTLTVTQQPPGSSAGGGLVGGIDLAVTAVSAPVSASSGGPLTISATIQNRSGLDTGPFRIGLYINGGSSVGSAGDTLLDSCDVPSLAANASVTCRRSPYLPWGTPAGKYAVGAIADDQNQVPDPDRGNNVRTSDAGPVSVTLSAQAPVIAAAGVLNAASYRAGGIAPGELVTIFGSNLGAPAMQYPRVSASGTVDTQAGGTRVLFDGAPAPMIYARADQVSAVAPFEIAGTTKVQVESLGIRSSPISIAVVASAPAIFTSDGSGGGPGAIQNEDFSLNASTNPAARGTWIEIWATGGGAMRPAVSDGSLGAPPFAQLSLPVSVRIGGVDAQVMYAGEASGIVAGVLQIDVIVPAGAPSGAVPVEMTIGGVTSQPGVTVAIR